MQELKPITISPRFDEYAEKKIITFLTSQLFVPILAQMGQTKKILFNSSSIIESAIKSGRIQYADTIFKGDFNSSLAKEFSKLGMKYDQRIKGYRKDLGNLPLSLQTAIAQTESKYKTMADNMLNAIETINYDEALSNLDFSFGRVIESVDKDFKKTVNKVIGVDVDLSQGQKDIISRDFSQNLKLYIKDFTDEQILILRKDIESAVFSGIRAEELQKIIIERFGVSQSKSKFLAKQEISLLTSKYKEAKYKDAGIDSYKWSISNVRTRPDHRSLNGKIFYFNDPPVTNQDTGARNNPGEDYGCNCVAIPLVGL